MSPPSGGTAPAAAARLPDGELIHLSEIAHEISRRYFEENPDEVTKYGDAGFAWCVHDNQWLLSWAAGDFEIGWGYFVGNVRWLARVLTARDYPAERLARDLELAAEVVGDASDARRELADKLREGARVVRGS